MGEQSNNEPEPIEDLPEPRDPFEGTQTPEEREGQTYGRDSEGTDE